jgi:hypothetical protein
MVIAGSTCNEVGLETLIRGHEANLYLGGRHCELRPERIFADEIDPERIECEDIGNDQDQLRLNWLKCIRTREPADSQHRPRHEGHGHRRPGHALDVVRPARGQFDHEERWRRRRI